MRFSPRINCRQAGLHVAVALETYSNEERVSTDTIKILVSSLLRIQLSLIFLPLPLCFPPCFLHSISFCPPFPLFVHSLSWTKPDHWHAADVIVATETEASQQRGCAEMVRPGEKVTMGQLFKNASCLNAWECTYVFIGQDVSAQIPVCNSQRKGSDSIAGQKNSCCS